MIRRICFVTIAFVSLLAGIFLGGCGSENKEGTNFAFTRVSEAACAQCHGQAVSSVTAQSLYGGWQTSSHFLLPADPNDPFKGADQTVRADCQRCHGGGSAHNGIGPIQFPKPDVSGICAQCHNAVTFAARAPQHVTSVTFVDANGNTVTSATYMDSVTICTNCHDPHDTTLTARFGNTLGGIDSSTGMVQLYADWAGSAHAAVMDTPWVRYDFKTLDVCNRCHTTKGYVKYVTTGDSSAWASVNSTDKNKEVLRCDGCHASFAWTRRSALTAPGGVQLPYGTYSSVIPSPAVLVLPFGKVTNNSTSTVVSDVGDADLCINCHSGTNSGKGIDTAPISVLTGTFAPLNSHYFGAAGNLYTLNGYEYRPHETYFKPVIPAGTPTYPNPNGSPGFEHYQIGVVAAFTGTTRGPCVGCHMYTTNPPPLNGSHTLTPVIQTPSGPGPRGIINGTITSIPAFSPVCSTCHTSGFPVTNPDDAPDIALGGAADINTLKSQYAARLAALEAALNAKGIFYDPNTYPYFFNSAAPATRVPFTLWPNRGTLGAAFNLNNLTREPGGYVHNHWYSALLIYDSLDFLDDGVQNNSYANLAIFPTGRSLSGPLY